MGNSASIGRAIRQHLSTTIADVMVLACKNVRDATPVDTTHAASNWILSVGSPYTGVEGSRASPSYAKQDASIQAMSGYDVGRDGKVYLRNNVLYLQFLDAGSSQQADPGFVAKALDAAARAAAYGRKQAARKMLKHMSRTAYLRTY